jgi:uncharacterized membrane protein
MVRRDSCLIRSLEPLFGLLWPLFLVWTSVVALLWTTGLTAEQITAAIANPGLREALLVIFRAADTLWLLLAAANLYLALAERVGLATARMWAIVIVATGAVIALASVRTGWPLGPVLYTTHLGMKLGGVSLGWPLWWFVVVVGGRMLAERLLSRASYPQLALATGVLAFLTQINLEPLAWKVRLFWFWYAPGTHLAGQPLWRNYATWWLVATVLAFLLRERQVAATARPPQWRTALILILMNAVFVLTHIAVALRA